MNGVHGDAEWMPLDSTDLSAWLGEPIIEDEDVTRAGAVLRFAWALVNTETGRSMTYWRDSGLPQDVSEVVLQVASRGYGNPESWGNERVDDWGAGGRPVEQLGMYLTVAEKGILGRFAERALRSIGVLKTVRDHHHRHDYRLVPTDGGSEIIWYG